LGRPTPSACLIKAARAAGEEITRVEIGREGRIVVVIGKDGAAPPEADSALKKSGSMKIDYK
jgi:hypothetical protein